MRTLRVLEAAEVLEARAENLSSTEFEMSMFSVVTVLSTLTLAATTVREMLDTGTPSSFASANL